MSAVIPARLAASGLVWASVLGVLIASGSTESVAEMNDSLLMDRKMQEEYMKMVPADAVPWDMKGGKCMANGVRGQHQNMHMPTDKHWFTSKFFGPGVAMANHLIASACPFKTHYHKTLKGKQGDACCNAVVSDSCNNYGIQRSKCDLEFHRKVRVDGKKLTRRQRRDKYRKFKACMRGVKQCKQKTAKYCKSNMYRIPRSVLGPLKVFSRFLRIGQNKRRLGENTGQQVHAKWFGKIFRAIKRHVHRAIKHVKKAAGNLTGQLLQLIPKDLRGVVQHILKGRMAAALKAFMAIPKYKKIVTDVIKKFVKEKHLEKMLMRLLSLDLQGATMALYAFVIECVHPLMVILMTKIGGMPWQYYDCAVCKKRMRYLLDPSYEFDVHAKVWEMDPSPGTPMVVEYSKSHSFRSKKQRKSLKRGSVVCRYQTTLSLMPCYPVYKTHFNYMSNITNRTIKAPICRSFTLPQKSKEKSPWLKIPKIQNPKRNKDKWDAPKEIPQDCGFNYTSNITKSCSPEMLWQPRNASSPRFIPNFHYKTKSWHKAPSVWALKHKPVTKNYQCRPNKGTFFYPRIKSLRCMGARVARSVGTRVTYPTKALKEDPHECFRAVNSLDTGWTTAWATWSYILTDNRAITRCFDAENSKQQDFSKRNNTSSAKRKKNTGKHWWMTHDACGCQIGTHGWSGDRRPKGCQKTDMSPKCGCVKGATTNQHEALECLAWARMKSEKAGTLKQYTKEEMEAAVHKAFRDGHSMCHTAYSSRL
jgi:hypothetical protein